jgi:hypothetical protein
MVTAVYIINISGWAIVVLMYRVLTWNGWNTTS